MKEKHQGKKLKELRYSIGFNQKQISELIGIHPSAYCRYEKDDIEMSYNLFCNIEQKVEQYKKQTT